MSPKTLVRECSQQFYLQNPQTRNNSHTPSGEWRNMSYFSNKKEQSTWLQRWGGGVGGMVRIDLVVFQNKNSGVT